MATPAKAFIDPTGISWMGQPLKLLPPDPKLYGNLRWGAGMALYFEFKKPPFNLVVTAFRGAASIAARLSFITRTPVPPMGRMIVNTFPPIYKERTKEAASTPWQVYPRGLE